MTIATHNQVMGKLRQAIVDRLCKDGETTVDKLCKDEHVKKYWKQCGNVPLWKLIKEFSRELNQKQNA